MASTDARVFRGSILLEDWRTEAGRQGLLRAGDSEGSSVHEDGPEAWQQRAFIVRAKPGECHGKAEPGREPRRSQGQNQEDSQIHKQTTMIWKKESMFIIATIYLSNPANNNIHRQLENMYAVGKPPVSPKTTGLPRACQTPT